MDRFMTVLTPEQRMFRRDLAACQRPLWRCALALTRDPHRAEDLVQDTLERALRFEHTYEPGSNLQGWLARVMRNVFVSGCRRRAIERRVLRQMALAERGAAARPEQPWLSPKVERALDALPEKIGSVVRLVDLGDMSYGDAASELEVPVGTVMSRLHRGRKRLAACLQDGEAKRAA